MFDKYRNELYLSAKEKFKKDVKSILNWLMDEGLEPTVENIMKHLDCDLRHVREEYILSIIEEEM